MEGWGGGRWMMEDVEMMVRFSQGSSTTATDSSSSKDIDRDKRESETRLGVSTNLSVEIKFL